MEHHIAEKIHCCHLGLASPCVQLEVLIGLQDGGLV